ncbi:MULTISPECIES: 3-phosphoshikimate 1-carboxyvinyltransferase [Nitrosomonas]|uniref:3-phosphoshikimate 1-carboxyvinyltransferase n=1 Tax=Nitrosomonas communis TaxID=44574 RepID=A0A0F7KH08_9PROT|nr:MULTISPECIES: 3-phosphoshikimate 1-carboxyvinyltransferase [Nitrosomonas]AKH38373.1 3-phosphoshikimate 1-carboxyvinyltransferase [Nitrosomonas communis]TYP90117.1 3-phosphoshikimate 1-carboxyvinyltransferase [Nitrosomonas communis]UVS60379.1 3-phosphoshikimate 1-carboxyvinyltransferase [Nitrosomonas sp. PLL12]
MDWLDLPAANAARGIIQLPGSKSISNRILLLAALANGKTLVQNLLISDDTAQMLKALETLGVKINQINKNDYSVEGIEGKFPVKQADLFLGNAGTAFRPLVAVLAIMGGHYRLSGVARMHERPIADLVNALRQLNANIAYLGNEGFPPLEIKPAKIQTKAISIKGDVSSQFLSGLLMALPLTSKTTTIMVNGILISRPYVELTLAQMARFGVQVIQENWQQFTVTAPQAYKSPGEIIVEGDASSASYFLAAGAIGGGPVRVEGVGTESLQGDIHFADALEKMGAYITKGKNWIESSSPISDTSRQSLQAIDLDCNHIPDAAMTLATTALFAKGTTTLRNIASWRVKETDRISAMAKELRKVGALVEEGKDFIRITPPATALTPHAIIDTYDDHRMAMCFSLVSLGVPLRINDPGCVAKTFPDYFEKFAMIVHS